MIQYGTPKEYVYNVVYSIEGFNTSKNMVIALKKEIRSAKDLGDIVKTIAVMDCNATDRKIYVLDWKLLVDGFGD